MADELVNLEMELHDPSVRNNPERLNHLLHDSFLEIGRSGTVYEKSGILNSMREARAHAVWSQDYAAQTISNGLVLLTYRSAHIGAEQVLSCFTRRSSLWERTGDSWKLRYHQGTPCSAFTKSTT